HDRSDLRISIVFKRIRWTTKSYRHFARSLTSKLHVLHSRSPGLEGKSQSQLHLAHRLSGRDRPKITRCEWTCRSGCRWSVQADYVENVQRFSTELKVKLFAKLKCPGDRQIHIAIAWLIQEIARRVPGNRSSIGRSIPHKCRVIEPAGCRSY